jgi:hypothetical protein
LILQGKRHFSLVNLESNRAKYFGAINGAASVRTRRTGQVAILLPRVKDNAMITASATG